ncbi:MAG: DUF72 domain-containing protein [Calditrichaeota bacterium]|nr:MAG: DUF72 domain-containing protein [Calditrichota bacterium]
MDKSRQNSKKIYVGPAGWSYPDWRGTFYPAKANQRIDQLVFIAQYFNFVEINSSYYHPPSTDAAQTWCSRVAGNKDFRFTAKLWQKFILERSTYTNKDIESVQKAFDILFDAGLLGAILIQFPQSFQNKLDERSWLFRILTIFKMYPLVVELRHASWNVAQTFDLLKEMDAGFVNIDQPVVGKGIGFTEIATSPTGYFRFHGRNKEMWFNENAGRDDRYNYTYTKSELQTFLKAVKTADAQSETVYVVFNNHFKGQAVRNAFEFMYLLKNEKLDLPDSLIKTYPDLIEIRKSINPEQLELF